MTNGDVSAGFETPKNTRLSKGRKYNIIKKTMQHFTKVFRMDLTLFLSTIWPQILNPGTASLGTCTCMCTKQC